MSEEADWSALEIVKDGFGLRWRRFAGARTAIEFEMFDEWCLGDDGTPYVDDDNEVMLEVIVRDRDSCADWMTPECQGYSHFCEPADAFKLARTFARAWEITAEQNPPETPK